jgi:hypothetical protein
MTNRRVRDMRTIASLALLFTVSSFTAVRADEDGLERAVTDFVKKLSPEGPSGKLIELAKTEAGRGAIAEAMRESVAWKLRGYERDPETHFENHLFARDEDGTLRPRPERSADFDSIRKAVGEMKAKFEDFNKRADALVARIVETTEIDKRVKAAWKDSRYRLARFADLEGDREEDGSLEEMFSELLRRDDSGKLHVREGQAEEIDELVEEVASSLAKGSVGEAAYAAAVDRLKEDEAKRVMGSAFARAYIRAKIGGADDEGGDPFKHLLLLNGLVDGEAVAMANLRKEVEAGQRLMVSLKERLDGIVSSLADEGDANRMLKTFLADEASRVALVARTLSEKEEGGDPIADFFREVEMDEFEARGDGLGVPATRFTDEEGEVKKAATPEQVDRELQETVREFAHRQGRFLDMAERCTDASVAELLSMPLAAPALERKMGALMKSLERAALEKAPAAFARRYLAGTGDTMAWRADRASKVDEIAARAKEIELEREAEEKDADKDEAP